MTEEVENPESLPVHATMIEDANPDGAVVESELSQVDHEPRLPFPIVGIGASAGGVEAYAELLTALAADTNMAFVLVPHLSAEHESHLVEILARHSGMPVTEVVAEIQPQPNHIYVIPRGTRLTIAHGKFHLEPRQSSDRVPMPIDYFFRSLAAQQKNRAVGVVLSGMDSDGALGLKAIKGEGGIAIVQTPESAQYPDMPKSGIAVDHVDLILPPAQIGLELARLARQFARPGLIPLERGHVLPETEQQFNRILTLLRGVSGIDFRFYKPATVRRRIARRMLIHKLDDLKEYVQLLQSRPGELRDLQEDVLINVTRFFRDPEVFDSLARDVFPRLFAGRPIEEQVRVWVSACSSGEEAYSFAMCLLEYFAGEPIEPPIQIFGTDVSDDSIEKARAGVYPQSIISDVSPERLRRFFVREKGSFQVSKRVRDLCIFARQNLSNDPPFSRLDLISCRNVLIYLEPKIQKSIIQTFNYALRPDGCLLLGSSESIGEQTRLFTILDRQNKVYTKVDDASNSVDVVPRVVIETGRRMAGQLPGLPGWSEVELQRAADRIVLARYGPAGVVINDRLEILQMRGHIGPFLGHPPGSASLHLLRMTREPLTSPLQDAVQRSIGGDIPVRVEGVRLQDGFELRDITIEVLPMQSAPPRGRCYLVLFLPSADAGPLRNGSIALPSALVGEIDPGDHLVSRLREDLAANRLYLQSLIEERDARNDELSSAYEEIQSANEELQSINEELVTAKEELQSANEELQTVNEELRTGNAALQQASNDISNLLNSVNIPVVMLDNQLTIRRATPPAERLLRVRQSDIGRRIGEIRLNLIGGDIEPMLQEVLDSLGTKERDVQDVQGCWYVLRARPYRTAENKIDGVVVVLVDVDQIRRGEQALRQARDLAQSVIETVRVPLAVLDTEFRVEMANLSFRTLSGVPKAEIENRSFPDLVTLLWNMTERSRSPGKSACDRARV